MPPDLLLLAAAQAAGSSPAVRDEFVVRFAKFLKYCAGKHCRSHKLPLDYIDDVVSMAIVMFFDPKVAKFSAAKSTAYLAYLEGLVRNAAKIHWRFIHTGAKKVQHWDDPLIDQLGLPTCLDEIETLEQVPPIEVAEEAAIALSVATPNELVLIHRHFFEDESILQIAVALGIARTTVTRRLNRYYARAKAKLAT